MTDAPDDRRAARIAGGMFAAGFGVFFLVFSPQAMVPLLGETFAVSADVAVLTVSAAALGVAASVLPWASLADRIGRRRVIVLGMSLAAVVALGSAFAPDLGVLLGMRLLLGLAVGGVPAVGIAYLTDELGTRRGAIAAGTFVAGNTFGGVCGRIVGGLVGEAFGWAAALGVLAVVAAASAICAAVVLPAESHRGTPGGVGGMRHALAHLRNPQLLLLMSVGAATMGGFATMYSYLGLVLLAPPISLPAVVVGFIFVAYLAGTLTSRWSGHLVHRWGTRRVVVTGAAVGAVGVALTALPFLATALGGLVVFTAGCFLLHPTASALSARVVTAGRAQATALYQLSWLLGTSALAWAGGLLFVAWGWLAVCAFVIALLAWAALAAARAAAPLEEPAP